MKKIYSLFFCLMVISVFAQIRKTPLDLKAKGDYKHLSSKTDFPELWAGFQREQVISYDMKNDHIAVTYVQQTSKKNKTVLTLYLYPDKYIDNQQLRDSFYAYQYALNQNSDKNVEIKPSFGSLSNENLKVNYIYTIFRNAMGQADFFKGVKYVDKNSLISIYECGGWVFKTRVSSDEMSTEQLKELKDKVENYFGILNVASLKNLPQDRIPDIMLSATVKRDSMMIHATSFAAQSKIEWLAKNLEKKEMLTGFNDMKIDSEVFATEKMIDFYKTHEKDWTVSGDTKKYFEEMIRIAQHGRLKDHIFEKYHGLIDYPEGESRKADYIQFKIDKDISENTNEIFYKIFFTLD